MSQTLIDHSPDLRSLIEDGYDVEIIEGHVVLRDVPYVKADRTVGYADLFCPLDLSGDVTRKPSSHVIHWTGEDVHHSDGSPISSFHHPNPPVQMGSLTANRTFSARADYRDFRHKLLTYAGRLEAEAHAIDENATARHYRLKLATESESVFRYIDNASSRAELTSLNKKLRGEKVAIVGLGGTGSFVLDFVSKCEGVEIHVFDADEFQQHNAFRAPGAVSREVLAAEPLKVDFYKWTYERLRKEIHAHEVYIGEDNIQELYGMTHVFLCIDNAVARKFIVTELLRKKIPFTDVGLGVVSYGDSLGGIVRVVRGEGFGDDEILDKMPLADRDDPENLYRNNAQVIELNALNAAMAVMMWKKRVGYYRDSDRTPYLGYSIAADAVVHG